MARQNRRGAAPQERKKRAAPFLIAGAVAAGIAGVVLFRRRAKAGPGGAVLAAIGDPTIT